MKTKIATVTISLLMIMALTGVLYASGSNEITIIDQNGTVFCESGGTGCYFLPSYISPSAVKFGVPDGMSLEYERESGNYVKYNGEQLDISDKLMTVLGKEQYVLRVKCGDESKILRIFFADKLSSIHVETTELPENLIKNNLKDESSKISVVNPDGSYEYFDVANTSEIKVRGNTTKDYAKKPFQIKLTSKTDLFGMGEAKTWILLANYLDQSLLRNSTMYEIGRLLGMHTSEFRSVDLFINGEYYGIYLLCEKVQIQENRLNITDLEKATDALNTTYQKSATTVSTGPLINETIITQYTYIEGVKNPDDITGGYLIELDNNYYRSELCYFSTSNGNNYVVKSPEYASKEQVEYIARLFGEMEEAIMANDGKNRLGKHYSDYIDIDSFAAAYIAAELGRNYDAGSSSMYFYKDADKGGQRSKIFKGPLWDCDNTLGNIHKNGASNQTGYWARGRSIWGGLTAKDDFNDVVANKLKSVYNEICRMAKEGGFIDSEVKKLGASLNMEIIRTRSGDYSTWPLYYDGTHYDRWQSSQVFNFIPTYTDGEDSDNTTVIGYLKCCLLERMEFLGNEWDAIPSQQEGSGNNQGGDTTVDTDTGNQGGTGSQGSPDTGEGNQGGLSAGNQDTNNGGSEKSVLIGVIVMVSVIALLAISLSAVLFIKLKKVKK